MSSQLNRMEEKYERELTELESLPRHCDDYQEIITRPRYAVQKNK